MRAATLPAFIVLATAALTAACARLSAPASPAQGPASDPATGTAAVVATATSTHTPADELPPCGEPTSTATAFATLVDLTLWLNTLPRPLSLPCFLARLPRPLALTATSGTFSRQPSAGADNPRIFVRVGRLMLTVVPSGAASQILELSELDAEAKLSVKGELVFPVTDELDRFAAYERIRLAPTGTSCSTSLCHAGESLSSEPAHGGKAYISPTQRISAAQMVPFSTLQKLAAACGDSPGMRCEMLRAVMSGSVHEQTFLDSAVGAP